MGISRSSRSFAFAAILDYAERIEAAQRIEQRLNTFLASPDAIYSYQNYQILHWMGRVLNPPSLATVAHARRFSPSTERSRRT